MLRAISWLLAVVVLLVTGVMGVYNGIDEMHDAYTRLQQSVTIGVLVYGVLGLAALVALIARHRSAVWLAILWGIVVTYVASTAAIAYAGSDATVVGAVAGGLGAALIAWAVVWSVQVATTRRAPRAEAARQAGHGASADVE